MPSSSSSPAHWPEDAELLAALLPWMRERRWFPLKGDVGTPESALTIVADRHLSARVRDLLLSVARSEEAPVLVHVPLVLASPAELLAAQAPDEAPGSAGFLLDEDGPALVDGPHHPDFWIAWANASAGAGTVLGAGAEAIARRARAGRVMTGEQSNTNVILPASADGETGLPDLVVKLLRVLAPGRNPEVEVSVALAEGGWDRVRTPVAWSILTWRDPSTGATMSSDSAVACTFIPAADDGFELFCARAGADDGPWGEQRRLTTDLARELGATTAQMHERMGEALGVFAPQSPAELARALRARAEWAMGEVAFLGERIAGMDERIGRAYDRLAALDALEPAIRIHGDYHLGQVLHEREDPGRWFVLDFEGEPLRPLAERSRPDQPLRDLAGMLRSFDYAAAVGACTDPTWLADVRAAFLAGYAAERPRPSREDAERARILLAALELDKALYEAVYEAQNRPAWISIPTRALEAILS